MSNMFFLSYWTPSSLKGEWTLDLHSSGGKKKFNWPSATKLNRTGLCCCPLVVWGGDHWVVNNVASRPSSVHGNYLFSVTVTTIWLTAKLWLIHQEEQSCLCELRLTHARTHTHTSAHTHTKCFVCEIHEIIKKGSSYSSDWSKSSWF